MAKTAPKNKAAAPDKTKTGLPKGYKVVKQERVGKEMHTTFKRPNDTEFVSVTKRKSGRRV